MYQTNQWLIFISLKRNWWTFIFICQEKEWSFWSKKNCCLSLLFNPNEQILETQKLWPQQLTTHTLPCLWYQPHQTKLRSWQNLLKLSDNQELGSAVFWGWTADSALYRYPLSLKQEWNEPNCPLINWHKFFINLGAMQLLWSLTYSCTLQTNNSTYHSNIIV